MDELSASKTGFTQLEASSLAVGLPEGLMGNSEVGHLNIGAGRVVWQDVVRIDTAVNKGTFADNDVIKATMEGAAKGNGRLHLCGLVSHGGVVSGEKTRATERIIRPLMLNLSLACQADTPLRASPCCQEV